MKKINLMGNILLMISAIAIFGMMCYMYEFLRVMRYDPAAMTQQLLSVWICSFVGLNALVTGSCMKEVCYDNRLRWKRRN